MSTKSIRITDDCFMIISRQLSKFIGKGKHTYTHTWKDTHPRLHSQIHSHIVYILISIGPNSKSSTHSHRIVFLSLDSSEINLFNAVADALFPQMEQN